MLATTDEKKDTRQSGKPWGLDEASAFIGICKRSLERAIKRGELKTFKIGGRHLIPDGEFRRFAAGEKSSS